MLAGGEESDMILIMIASKSRQAGARDCSGVCLELGRPCESHCTTARHAKWIRKNKIKTPVTADEGN
jgi:hypothetical protein